MLCRAVFANEASSNEIQRLSRPQKQAVRQLATFRGSSNHYVLDPMFHDQ